PPQAPQPGYGYPQQAPPPGQPGYGYPQQPGQPGVPPQQPSYGQQPPYGQAPYGMPPQPPAPGGGGKKAGIVIGAVAIVAALGVG
ncbi:membrane protein, partial [Streptomyces caelestis]